MKLRVQVRPGEVRLSSVSIVYQSKHCVVLVVDSHTKRPDVADGGPREIIFSGGPESLYLKKGSTEPTILSVTGLGRGEWIVTLDTARYTTYVTIVRRKKKLSPIWWDRSDS